MNNTREAMRRNTGMMGIVAAVLLIALFHAGLTRLQETRAWRDVTAETPFFGVVVTSQAATPAGLEVAGTMHKRRCSWVTLTAYVRVNGTNLRTGVDTSPEDARRPAGDRAPVAGAQAWGPWVVEWPAARRAPSHWEVWAWHKCPEYSGPQPNLFASGEWSE